MTFNKQLFIPLNHEEQII